MHFREVLYKGGTPYGDIYPVLDEAGGPCIVSTVWVWSDVSHFTCV